MHILLIKLVSRFNSADDYRRNVEKSAMFDTKMDEMYIGDFNLY
jgi:hypothetical protein